MNSTATIKEEPASCGTPVQENNTPVSDEIQSMAHKNLALELLKRLLNDEIKSRSQTNLVQGRKFSEMLAESISAFW